MATEIDNKPTHIAYHVKEVEGGETDQSKGIWVRIGAAFSHSDGKGVSLDLDAFPVGTGRIVLREPRERDD